MLHTFTSYVGTRLYESAAQGRQQCGRCGCRLQFSAESRVLLSIEEYDHPVRRRHCYQQPGHWRSAWHWHRHWLVFFLSVFIHTTSVKSYHNRSTIGRSFVRSLRAGVQPTLDPTAETFWIGPMRQPRERRGVYRCVCVVCTLCSVKEGK